MNLLQCFAAAAIAAASVMAAQAGAPTTDPKLETVENPNNGMIFVLPKAGPLRFEKADAEGAHFSGSVRLSGHYEYGHTNAEAAGDPVLSFYPDEASKLLLPYWRARGPVENIFFSNPEGLIKAALTPSGDTKVRQHKIKSVTGQLTIWIDGFVADGECDAPYYSARFVKNLRTGALVSNDSYVWLTGC